MGTPREAPVARLFAAVMHAPEVDADLLIAGLEQAFGPIDLRSESFSFDHSRYYEPEMGAGLRKFFLAFEHLVSQDELPAIKLFANDLEEAGRQPDGSRTFNIDPGLLTLTAVILATTKGFAHRIYMGRGIYEELTLLYRDGAYAGLPWTYADYLRPESGAWFLRVRELLRRQLALPRPAATGAGEGPACG